MKKLSILLIGLLLITGFAAAVDFDGSVSVGGSGTVVFGVDLDTNLHGFRNSFTSTLSITLVAKASVEKGGDDGLYGWIKIADFTGSASAASGLTMTAGAVTAKIVVSPAEIIIYKAPTMAWGNAAVIETGDPDIAPALASDEVVAATIGGITIVLPVDPAKISVYVVSDGDWVTNSDSDYAAGTDVTVTIDIITVSLGGFYGWFDAAGTWGGTAKLAVALADVLNGVNVSVGADIVDPGTWEVAFATTVNLTEANADDAKGNVGLGVFYSQAADLDVKLTASEPLAGGFVEDVSAGLTLLLLDLTSGTIGWNINVTGSYSSGGLTPSFTFDTGSDQIVELMIKLALGAAFTGIDNTTVTLTYDADDLTNQSAAITNDIGDITVDVTVAY